MKQFKLFLLTLFLLLGTSAIYAQTTATTDDKDLPLSILMAKSNLKKPSDGKYWKYDNSLIPESMIDVYLRYKDTYNVSDIKKYVDDYMKSAVTGTIAPGQLDYIRPGLFMIKYHNAFNSSDSSDNYLTKAKAAMTKLQGNQKVTVKDVEGVGDVNIWEHKNKNYPQQVWLDGLYMAQPFYVKAAGIRILENGYTQDSMYTNSANMLLAADKATYNSDIRIWKHVWDGSKSKFWRDNTKIGSKNSAASFINDEPYWGGTTSNQSCHTWGRALGWYAMAILDVMDNISEKEPNNSNLPKLKALYTKVMKRVVDLQDPTTHCWHNVLDVDGNGKSLTGHTYKFAKNSNGKWNYNWIEGTATAMFSYCLLKGVREGWLVNESGYDFLTAAKNAFTGMVSNRCTLKDSSISLDSCMTVGGLGKDPYDEKENKPSPRDGSFDYYNVQETFASNDCKGVGPFIWAALEAEQIGYVRQTNSFEQLKEKDITTFKWSKTSDNITLGDKYTAPTIVLKNVNGDVEIANNVEFTINGDNIIKVSTDGTITLIAGQTGTAKVTASLKSGSNYEWTGANPVYTITVSKQKTAKPEISGTTPFTGSTKVTISGETRATIYYTTDGSTPTTASKLYSDPFTISSTTVVNAIAIAPNKDASDVATKTFVDAEEITTEEYTLSQETKTDSSDSKVSTFTSNRKNFTLSPADGGTGYTKTLKYSKGKDYTITLPDGLTATSITFTGYTNSSDADGGIDEVQGTTCTDKTFPAKASNASSQQTSSYTFPLNNVTGAITFSTISSSSSSQVCLVIKITATNASTPVKETVATPTIDGTTPFDESTTVTISDATDGATIQYSTDGGENWNTYSKAFTINETTTVSAKATKDGMNDSETATKTFTKNAAKQQVATPTITGTTPFTTSTEVKITDETEGATILYSTDNGAKWTQYTSPLTITETTTITAKATKEGMNDSETASATFTKSSGTETGTVETPVISGETPFTTSTTVTITDATEGATILYSTDVGYTWNTYTEPFDITESTTVYAKAEKEGWERSALTNKEFIKSTAEGGTKTWDFSTVNNSEDLKNLEADAKTNTNWSYTTSSGNGRYCNVKTLSDEPLVTTAGTINVTDGLLFTATASDDIRFNYQEGPSGKGVMWYGDSVSINIPNAVVGQTISIRFASSKKNYKRGFALSSNLKAASESDTFSNSSTSTYVTHTAKVTEAGEAKFTTNGGVYVQKIETVIPAKQETEEIKTAPFGYTTYSSNNALDFSKVDGVVAYIVIRQNGTTATCHEVKAVPAKTGILIKGEPSTVYSIPNATGATDDVSQNLLIGTLDTPITDNSAYDKMVFANGSHGPGFYSLSRKGTLAAHKAYIMKPTSGAKYIGAEFEDEPTTDGIGNIVFEELNEDEPMYNLAGQRVTRSYRGVVIQNGKKYMLK